MRPVIVSVLSVLFALAICLVLATSAQASPTGMQIFVNTGMTTANTGNINTATSFTFGSLTTTSVDTGVFAGMPAQTWAVSFMPSNPAGLTFGNSLFGTFTSTSITETSNSPGEVSFAVVGNWTAGTVSTQSGTFPAVFTISLTQTPWGSGLISFSASFATPDPTPEPSSIVLVLSGLALGVVIWGFQRGRAYLGRRQVAMA